MDERDGIAHRPSCAGEVGLEEGLEGEIFSLSLPRDTLLGIDHDGKGERRSPCLMFSMFRDCCENCLLWGVYGRLETPRAMGRTLLWCVYLSFKNK